MGGSRFLWLEEGYWTGPQCRSLYQAADAFREARGLSMIHRRMRGRSLRYYVIHGEQVAQAFPELALQSAKIKALAERLSGIPLQFMADPKVGININITPPGGEYRWHYDRNALTALLFLNAVPGGETEIYPGYRIHLNGRTFSKKQAWLDRLLMNPLLRLCLAKKQVVIPQMGNLLLMRGDRCLHSVCRVGGDENRINVIFSFDRQGTVYPQGAGLDDYLYTTKPPSLADPNYLSFESRG